MRIKWFVFFFLKSNALQITQLNNKQRRRQKKLQFEVNDIEGTKDQILFANVYFIDTAITVHIPQIYIKDTQQHYITILRDIKWRSK